MSQSESDTFAHVIASIDTASREGEIRYVLPAKMRTSSAEKADDNAIDEGVRLVLKDATGKEIGRVRPELRFEACLDDEQPHRAMIQQDIDITSALSEIDLEFNGKTLDTFRPEPVTGVDQQFRETATFGLPVSGEPGKLSLGTRDVEQRRGVSYMVQAKPDNADQWQTLAVGQSTPTFVVDKNQFPGASSVEVRITQNAGFQSHTVDQRTIKLE